MLKHLSTPAFTNNQKVLIEVPESTCQFDEERIWVRLHVVRIPISMILVPDNNFTVHEVLSCVTWYAINVQSLQFFDIRFHYLWPGLSIIQMDAIDSVLLRVLDNLVNEQLPSFKLPVVKHGCVLELLSLSISAVADVSSAILVQVMQ